MCFTYNYENYSLRNVQWPLPTSEQSQRFIKYVDMFCLLLNQYVMFAVASISKLYYSINYA